MDLVFHREDRIRGFDLLARSERTLTSINSTFRNKKRKKVFILVPKSLDEGRNPKFIRLLIGFNRRFYFIFHVCFSCLMRG